MRSLTRHSTKRQKGFTLIEILLAVVILAIVSAVAIPRFTGSANTAKTNACDANIANMNTQWERKAIETGSYGALADLTGSTDYFPDGAPVCPFGTAYADADEDNRVDAHSH